MLNVVPGGPADEDGLIAGDPTTGQGGDLIIAINGERVSNFGDLNSYLVFHTEVGRTVEMTVLRDTEELAVPLTLAARP